MVVEACVLLRGRHGICGVDTVLEGDGVTWRGVGSGRSVAAVMDTSAVDAELLDVLMMGVGGDDGSVREGCGCCCCCCDPF